MKIRNNLTTRFPISLYIYCAQSLRIELLTKCVRYIYRYDSTKDLKNRERDRHEYESKIEKNEL